VTTRLADCLEAYLARTREQATTALAVVPLVLVYGLGLLTASARARSNMDLVSTRLVSHIPTATYIGLQLGIAVALIFFALLRAERPWRDHLRWACPAVGEAATWGLFLGAIVIFVMGEARLLAIVVSGPLVDRTVLAAGAGLHEELVFRALLIPLLTFLLGKAIGIPKQAAIIGAVLLSSVVFSAAHHLAGEPFEGFVFLGTTSGSTHFYVDWDGTIFQTLDLAWEANHVEMTPIDRRSISIDLVNPVDITS